MPDPVEPTPEPRERLRVATWNLLPGRAANFDYTLDYQFTRPETLQADHAWTFGGADDGYPSDHLGVAVDYSVPQRDGGRSAA